MRAAKEHTMRADIVPGGIFPDYELTDHTKARRRLSELQGIDPIELAANYPKIRVACTQIVRAPGQGTGQGLPGCERPHKSGP